MFLYAQLSKLIMSTWWSNTTQNNSLALTNANGRPYLFGIKITSSYVGNYLQTATFWLKRNDTPTGDVTAIVLDSSGSTRETSTTTYDITSISNSSFEQKEFTFSGLQVNLGDYIMIDCSDITTSHDSMCLGGTDTSSSPCYDISNGSSTINEYTDRQTSFIFAGSSTPASSGTLLPPPVAWI
jgi:hypothetical protein